MHIFYLSAILLKGRFYWPAVGVAATTDPLLSLRSSCWEAALCMAAFWKLYPVWAHVEGPLEKWRHESLAQKFRCQLTYTPRPQLKRQHLVWTARPDTWEENTPMHPAVAAGSHVFWDKPGAGFFFFFLQMPDRKANWAQESDKAQVTVLLAPSSFSWAVPGEDLSIDKSVKFAWSYQYSTRIFCLILAGGFCARARAHTRTLRLCLSAWTICESLSFQDLTSNQW